MPQGPVSVTLRGGDARKKALYSEMNNMIYEMKKIMSYKCKWFTTTYNAGKNLFAVGIPLGKTYLGLSVGGHN